MAVLASVQRALAGLDVPEWQVELVFALASAMDDSPNASTAKELKALLSELVEAPAAKGDVADELAAARDARRRASGS